MIYLLDVLSNRIVDSAAVSANRFFFSGRLPLSPARMTLHTDDYAHSISLWLENANMTFDAAGGVFQQAKLKGSLTEDEAASLYMALQTTDDYEAQIEIALAFIAAHPDTRVSAEVLAGYSQNVGRARVRGLYELLSPANKASVYGTRIRRYLELNQDHETGMPYSDFAMNDPEGNTAQLSSQLGKATLLEFWASWCGPCREENPELIKIYQEYQPDGFRIFAVSLDFSAGNWKKAIQQDQLSWTHVSDLKGRDSTGGIIYGINTLPDNFLIDQDGRIVGRGLWGNELRAALDSLLRQ